VDFYATFQVIKKEYERYFWLIALAKGAFLFVIK
jgi:hypothetical protein